MIVVEAFTQLIAFFIAVTFREAIHGFVARFFGDTTAEEEGRLTLNPLKHMDPVGTIAFPGLLFLSQAPYIIGWAKPIPVDFFRLHPPRLGMMCVSASGSLFNFFLAIGAALLLHINPDASTLGNEILMQLIKVNIIIGIFNLLPFPPLDGGRILMAALPERLARPYAQIEKYSPLILIGLFLSPLVFQLIGIPFSPLRFLLEKPSLFIWKGVLFLSGHHA